MGPLLRIHTLGGLTISIDDTPVTGFDSRKVQALLVYLACTGRTQPREVLAELFWEERTQSQALANLRVALTSLRQTVEPFVEITRESVGLSSSGQIWLDISEFESRLSTSGDEITRIEAALDLYQGEFLAGFFVDSTAFEEWATLERERLRFRVMEATDTLIARHQESGAYAAGISAATRLLQMDALREKTHRQLMELLAQSGQRVAALNQYVTCQRLLQEELGISPAPETTTAYDSILAGQPQPAARPIVRVPHGDDDQSVSFDDITNPYKGLRPFLEGDTPDFFGREVLVAQLVVRLKEPQRWARFLAVVGPSGSGKSSVVRAGLIPALRNGALPGSERWWIAVMQPGAHPLLELEAALTQQADRPQPDLLDLLEHDSRGLLRALKRLLPADERVELCLVIDQFEELFSLVTDEAVRAHLLDSLFTALSDPHSRLRLILTLRADFYDWPLLYPNFGDLVRQRTEVILPLSPSELQRAIQSPAEQLGLSVERELVPAIVADVGSQPGALPLMEYALYELFERRDDRTLTLSAYQATGGVQGALLRRAEDVYQQLDSEHHALARQVFLRLVQLNEGGEDTRRRVPTSEIVGLVGSEETAQQIIDPFARHRLLTFDRDALTRDPTLEVAHEALIRTWPRLRTWLEESRDDIRQQRLLTAAATEWEHAGRDRGYLLSGSRLAQFEGWATATAMVLTPDELEFLNASIAEGERQTFAEQERQTRELKLARRAAVRLRYLVAGLIVFLIGAAALSGFALLQRNEARDSQTAAEREASVNHSLVLASKAEQEYAGGKTDLALSLALQAVSIDAPPQEAQRTLTDIAFSPGTRHIFNLHGDWFYDLAFSPDGQMVVSGSCANGSVSLDDPCHQGELFLWRVDNGELIRSFPVGEGAVCSVDFSPDGTMIVSGSGSCNGLGTTTSDSNRMGKTDMVLWDVSTGEAIRRFSSLSGWVFSVAFSPDGSIIAAGTGDKVVRLWDVQSGNEIRQLEGHSAEVRQVAFSPDGNRLYSVSEDTIYAWNLETTEEIYRLDQLQNTIFALAVNPSGQTFLTGGNDGYLRLWDSDTGEELNSEYLAASVDFIGISPDGTSALISTQSRLYLWDIDQWKATFNTLQDEFVGSGAVAISPDGRTGIFAPQQTAYILNLKPPGQLRRFPATNTPVTLALLTDGQRIVTGGVDGTLVLWDCETGEVIREMPGNEGQIVGVSVSPDGRLALAAAWDFLFGTNTTSLILWNLDTGEIIRRLEGFHLFVRSVAFSPDGKTALAGTQCYPYAAECDRGELLLFDITTGEISRTFEFSDMMVTDIVFSADGRQVLTGSGLPFRATLWDVATGQPIRFFEGQLDIVYDVAFGPDEQTVLAASADSTVLAWDLETGRALRRFQGHNGEIWGMDISPDGRYLITASLDRTVLLWDIETAASLRRYDNSSGKVFDVVFSTDGQKAYSAGSGASLIEWETAMPSLDELVAWVHENRYIRDFTCEEREQYRIEPLCE